jgi:membrane associated rhomboid family serine protease
MRNFIKQIPFVSIIFVVVNIALFYTVNTWEDLTLDTTYVENHRLLTSMFAHKNWAHLWVNMAMILFAGLAVELLVGRIRMIIMMIVAELVVGYFAINNDTSMVTGGASAVGYALIVACVFAMIKSYVIERRNQENWDHKSSVMDVIAGGCSILMSLVVPLAMWDAWSQYTDLSNGVANFAHFWGGAVGFILGLVFSISTIKQAVNVGIRHLDSMRTNARLNREHNARMREYWGQA